MAITPKKTALVLGASGGIGGETARALVRHGWRVRALSRDPLRDEQRASGRGDRLRWIAGDAMDPRSVLDAAAGAALIVHAVNPPGYRDWAAKVLPMIDHTIAAARTVDARVFLPGTVYNYGPDAFPDLLEDSPQNPRTRKGAIRVELEARLERAAAESVRSLVLRCGDFYGPRPGNSWFSQGMVKPGVPLRSISNPGAAGVAHPWAYLPDVGEAFARLADREGELDAFERFHFTGFDDRTGTQMAEAVARIGGTRRVRVKRLPWGLLRLMSPFNPTLREMLEMRYLWRRAHRLDNRRLVALLGEEPRTPLVRSLRDTLAGLGIDTGAATSSV